MKNLRLTILAALLLAGSGVAQAQAPVAAPLPPSSSSSSSSLTSPSGSSSTGGSTTANPNQDSGSINSFQGTSVTSTEQTTTTSSPGIGADGVEIGLDSTDDSAMLADTGGEPIIMSLLGLSVAAGAFFMRRRVSA
jgi:hypothetical protein